MTQQEYLDLLGSQPTSTNTIEQIIQSSTSPTIKQQKTYDYQSEIKEVGGDGGGGITKGPNRFIMVIHLQTLV